tara:strand:+ start:1953 stop:2780 length:828 start_codon:yes stop_codon:yes gene_type:complete
MNNFEIKCKNSDHIFKISAVDKDYIINLDLTWYFWKGEKHVEGRNKKCPGGYICAHLGDAVIYLHHVIMKRKGDKKPGDGYTIDHINQNKIDNTRENLRWATQSEQNANIGKRNRKYNAKPLPDGLTQDMMPKYVVYYNECYNKDKQLYRQFFKIEKHPKLGKKIIIGSKSKKFSILEKLEQIKEKLNTIDKGEVSDDEEINPDDDEITKLMKCPPAGIQYCKENEKRGSKYSIGRAKTPEGMSDVSSTGRRNVSDRDKFIQIYKKYVEFGLNKK